MKKIVHCLFFVAVLLWSAGVFAQTTISGAITYNGVLNQTDQVHIGVFPVPCRQIGDEAPDFGIGPISLGPYIFAVDSGTWYVCAFMDVGGDGAVPVPTDPFGEYPGNPIVTNGQLSFENIDVELLDPLAIPALGGLGIIVLGLLLALFAVRKISQSRREIRF